MQPSYNASAGRLYLSSQTNALATTTFGNQHVFAEVEQHSLDLTARLNVTFRPTLSLQFWVQPFAATGDYLRRQPSGNASEVVRRLCTGPSNNVFAVKATYWVSF